MKREDELVVLLHPDLEIDLEKPLAKVRSIITDNGGELPKKKTTGASVDLPTVSPKRTSPSTCSWR